MLLLQILLSLNAFALDCSEYPQTIRDWNKNSLDYSEDINNITFSGWVETQSKVRGIMLSIHGLNNNAKSMVELNLKFSDDGLRTLNTMILGQRGDSQEAKTVPLEVVQQQISAHYCIVKQQSQKLNIPLYLTGYSFGAALLTNFLLSHPEEVSNIAGLTLFAPAIELTWQSKVARISMYLPNHWVVRSQLHEDFRANRYTPVNLYASTWKTYLQIQSKNMKLLSDLPITVIMDPEDQMISHKELSKIVSENANWQMYEVSTEDAEVHRRTRHFVINPRGMAQQQWEQMTSWLMRQLNGLF